MHTENKKKWFALSPSVFIWRKRNECLFYDSDTFQSKLYYINNDSFDELITALQNIDNLYCVDITKTTDTKIMSLLDTLTDLSMGIIISKDETSGCKPVRFPPQLNLQSSVERLNEKELTDLTVGDNILMYIHEITVFFSENPNVKMLDKIANFIEAMKKSNLYAINISGYTHYLNQFEEFWRLLNAMPATTTIQLDFKDISLDTLVHIKELHLEHFELFIRIEPDFDKKLFDRIEDFLRMEHIVHEYEVVVTNDREVEAMQMIINDGIESMHIKPVFNGKNHAFFEENVYLFEDDIQNTNLTKKNIFAHQALNTHDFGKLTITPDGVIYANLHFPPLGAIEDDVRMLVYREMTSGTSWRRIRNMAPCSDCVYQWLCPSPSNYELGIGKPNLCHVTS